MTNAPTNTVYDIHVFDPLIGMTLYAHTYGGFESERAAKDHFVKVNPHHDPADVTATLRVGKRATA